MRITLRPEAKKAIMIGIICSISYLAVYVARNILGVVSPQMVEAGVFTNEGIGTLSSVYFISYAFGQLINGRIGDKIKGKHMISLGLILAGVCNFLFALLAKKVLAAYILYALTGFCLSMIYGPMTKVVAENTDPVYTTRCSLGYTFASFFGSPLAGILATLFVWQGVFASGSATLVIMGLVFFAVFTLFERKGIIQYGKYQRAAEKGLNLKVLIQNRILKFTVISVITGIVRTTVVFWLPTYLSQYLGFSSQRAAMLFTVATFVISSSAFIAVFLYERLRRNMDLVILISFILASAGFLAVFAIKQPVLNIIFLVLAILSSNCAASMLWSKYCPSLRDTGMVSSATGFLDFMSYLAAAVSSTVFANAVSAIGWQGLILVWLGLMLIGVAIALPHGRRLKRARVR